MCFSLNQVPDILAFWIRGLFVCQIVLDVVPLLRASLHFLFCCHFFAIDTHAAHCRIANIIPLYQVYIVLIVEGR